MVMQNPGRLFAAYGRNEHGAVAMTFALTTLPMITLVAFAINYSSGYASKAVLQDSLDSAVLAAMQVSSTNRVSRAQAVFNASVTGSNIIGASASFANNDDGTFSGTATGSAPGLANLGSIGLSASAKAQPTTQAASNVNFTLTAGYGWYWKQVNLYKHEPGDASDTLLASYTYQPTSQSGRGSGTVSATFLTAGSMVSGAVNTSVAMGTTYDKAYLSMTVYSDGCGPGMAPSTASGSAVFTCVTSGSRVQTGTNKNGQAIYTTYTKSATPVVYSTNDSATANHLFVQTNGVNSQMPLGSVPSIFTLLPCSGTIIHSWEDTPWSSSELVNGVYQGSWSQQDIFFSVQVTSCANNINYVSIPYLAQ